MTGLTLERWRALQTAASSARLVVPGYPYHVTHRGNRREDVFFAPQDRDVYRRWLREYAAQCE